MPKYEAVDLPKQYEAVDISQTIPTTPYRTPSGADIQPPGTILSHGEKVDRALEAIPMVGATVATLPVSAAGAATAGLGALIRAATIRSLAAGAGGAAGSVLQSSLQSSMKTPGAPKDTAEVINRAVESGVLQGAGQGIAEGIGIVGPATVKAGQRFAENLPKTRGGMQYLRGKWDEIKAAADARRATSAETAANVVEDFRAAYQPHEIGESAQDAATLFRSRFLAKEAEGYGKMEQALRGSQIDYRDVAKRLSDLEKNRPKAKGGLKGMTAPEADWDALVDSMRAGQRAESKYDAASGLYRTTVAPNAAEDAAAVLRARSTISQRLWDVKNGKVNFAEGHTKEYVKGLEDLLASIDQKIIGAANAIDPLLGEGYRELLKFSGSNREIMKSAIFKMAEENKGELAKALLSSRHPENVNLFMEMAKGGKMRPGEIEGVQRAAVESLLTRTKGVEKVIDLESFATRLAQTGEAGNRLFADPKAKTMIDNLKALSKEVRALPKKPADVGLDIAESGEAKLMEIAAAAAGYRFTNLVFLPREGYRVLTRTLMKIAENPKDYQKLHTLWKAYQTGAMTGPAAAKHAANAFRSYAAADAVFSNVPLAPAHEQKQ